MRLGHILLFLTAFTLAFGAVPAKKAPPKKGKVTVAKAPAKKGTVAKKGTSAKKPARPTYARQQVPSQERYREIQQALADQGYYKGEPNGVWGPESVDALKEFQAKQSLPVTGKLSARSLIGLGLGPKSAGPLVMPAPQAATGDSQH